jgi:cation diffusion facilitator CzcD-associated flavoprotein CzcO
MAAYAKHLGIDYLILGKPMDFWKANMPAGMYLRSACDWHLDPTEVHTIEKFLETRGLRPADVEPLSLDFYLSYAQWFQQQKEIEAVPRLVQKLDWNPSEEFPFCVTLDNGEAITAKHVVVAVGFKYFKHLPRELTERLPGGRWAHTCDLVDFTGLEGKRVLILGGRQSAFEWAALVNEAGAAEVHVSHRHDSPEFTPSDWSWVNPLVDAMADNPSWFRSLPQEQKDALSRRLWAEGRLKVEPWLKSRVLKDTIKLWPRTQIVKCEARPSGDVAVKLDNGQTLFVDHIVLATGYKVEIDQVPFLAQGNILGDLDVKDDFPVLDNHFQTNIPGLFITSMAATQEFGPFFAFTISARTSAKLIGQAIGGRGREVEGYLDILTF